MVKKAWEFEDAMDYISQQSGRHFDPELVPLFTQQKKKILRIMQEYQDAESLNIIRTLN